MKRTKLLLALLSTSTVAGVIDGPVGPELITPNVYSENVLSGFSNHDEYLSLVFSQVIYARYNLELSIIDLESTNIVYRKEAKLRDTEVIDSVRTYQLYLPFEQYLSSGGLNLVLAQTMGASETIISTAKVYPFVEEEINVSQYRKEPYVRDGVFLSIDDSKLHSTESFDFTDLNEFLTVERNNILDLSHLKFKYNCQHDFSSGDIYLKIKDYNDIFPNLNHFNGEVSLKMKFVQENNEISLMLNEPLYVNYNTYDLSSNPLENYEETNMFYLPKGKENLLEDNEIYIFIKDAGYSLTDFTIPFNFFLNNKYIGECYDSDYCITGGVKQ